MEFNHKLQELRKQKGLTQEELAEALYVSRAAISKWESGRGYPAIDSLKAIADFFSVSIDELLSTNEVLRIADEEGNRRESLICDLLYGILDISMSMLLFLPFFAFRNEGGVIPSSLLSIDFNNLFTKILLFSLVIGSSLFGVLTLALQTCSGRAWVASKRRISIFLGSVSVISFVLTLQPYAAIFAFVLLLIKVLSIIKR